MKKLLVSAAFALSFAECTAAFGPAPVAVTVPAAPTSAPITPVPVLPVSVPAVTTSGSTSIVAPAVKPSPTVGAEVAVTVAPPLSSSPRPKAPVRVKKDASSEKLNAISQSPSNQPKHQAPQSDQVATVAVRRAVESSQSVIYLSRMASIFDRSNASSDTKSVLEK